MSFVIAAPDLMAAAAANLAAINSSLSEAQVAAAARTSALVPAAADEVSTGIAQLFATHAHEFQGVAGQAAAFHQQFVDKLGVGATRYAGAEAANAAVMGTAEPISDIANTVLGVVLLPFTLVQQLLVLAINTFIIKPLYQLFIAPVFDAILRAIFASLFTTYRPKTTTTTTTTTPPTTPSP